MTTVEAKDTVEALRNALRFTSDDKPETCVLYLTGKLVLAMAEKLLLPDESWRKQGRG